ncbi:MAG: ribulose-phosphate 3-epimerase [Deltaproteobacteria bacterium]|nr:ribulose-phosphate 3-epimerase [Deltaproteobacteria bacterium]
MTHKLIAPSILSADFGCLATEIGAVENAGADLIHVDVMDGHFVPNITVGPLVVDAVRKNTRLPIDCHLMIQNPQNSLADFIKAGANWVSVHVEEGYHLDRSINLIKDLGAKAGVAINPATPVESIFQVLPIIDYVVIITVKPGSGGQSFIGYCTDKLKKVSDVIRRQYPHILIQIDGGVKISNIKELSDNGAHVFVSGSGIFHTDDYGKTITQMKQLIGASANTQGGS